MEIAPPAAGVAVGKTLMDKAAHGAVSAKKIVVSRSIPRKEKGCRDSCGVPSSLSGARSRTGTVADIDGGPDADALGEGRHA
jgi:hypothetical protein